MGGARVLDGAGKEVPASDPNAGLFARGREGTVQRVTVPEGCLGFRIGETAQVCSAGILEATPHAVRAARAPGVGRAQLAVFMEPEWNTPLRLPGGRTVAELEAAAAGRDLPSGVPALQGRWHMGDDFGAFTRRTLDAYHD